LSNGIYKSTVNGKEYRFHNCKFLKCIDCNDEFVCETAQELCDVIVNSAEFKDGGDFNFDKLKKFIKDDYISTAVEFVFDKDDYYFIPGLVRPWNIGFLTPVFFNIEVLLKYSYHPSYSLELGANSLGSIYKGQEYLIQFGVNPNGKVIMWLGDVGELEVEEQHYLRSENVQSDHSISSEFYEAEIEVKWANPSNERFLLTQRLQLYEAVLHKLGTSISQLLPETIKVAPKIKRPLVSTEEAFSEVIIPMNMIFVESINNQELKRVLEAQGVDVKDKKGLKLFELWIQSVLKIEDAKDIVSPLFVLYDLRIAMAHLQSSEGKENKFGFACERLGLDKNERDYLKVFDALIGALSSAYKVLLLQLESLPSEVDSTD